MRDYHAGGRSPIYATQAMAATSIPEATLTAIEVMKAGGNAMDAAIAAAAVLAVVEPQSTGLGGDCFCLYAPAGGGVFALNGSGRTPAGLSLESLAASGAAYDPSSVHTVTVPGTVAAWEALSRRFGALELGALLQPAIRIAEGGYAVAPRVAADWAEVTDKLRLHDAKLFLVDGGAPEAGTVMRNPQLGATLRAIAHGGVQAFYTGAVAADMVADLRRRGGFHTEADFADALDGAEFVAPISRPYLGHEVWECPPNGSGIVALMMMGMLEADAATADPLDPIRLHRVIEAARLAYRDRDAFIADPAQSDVPVAHLLSDAYLAALRSAISDERRIETLPEPGSAHTDTVYVAVVDRDGNACSFINSIFQEFGSGIVAGRSGVLMHNRGFGFSLRPGHPNQLAPRKRPMHTIIPALACKGGKPRIVFGVMGGQYQPIGQSWVLANLLAHGMDPQAALDLPRVFPYAGQVNVERGIPTAARAALAAKGHRIAELHLPVGGGQMIAIDHERGILVGGSDPRKDGCALGY